MSIYKIINKYFSYSSVNFTFLKDDGSNAYILVKDKDIYSLFDLDMNLILKDVNIDNTRLQKVCKNKKGEYSIKDIDSYEKEYNIVNYCCDVDFFIKRYNGLFLGVIKPDEFMESISAQIGDEKFIPVVLFNSHGPNLAETKYKDARGKIVPWIGDDDECILGENIKEYPWVIFFNGNDDSSYYCRFKTYYDAVTSWEIMKENNCIADGIEYLKKEHPKEAFLRQTHDKLLYLHQN